MTREITVTTHEQALLVYRHKDLRQALYDDGDVVMGDVLVNLHGDQHRARRRLENRLFTRPSLLHYERDLFPSIMERTLTPHVEAGEADLVSLGHQLMM
ncbi:MAG: cytochrome P450, partial [Actinomycetota bacterium]